jgi:hypothetical protein
LGARIRRPLASGSSVWVSRRGDQAGGRIDGVAHPAPGLLPLGMMTSGDHGLRELGRRFITHPLRRVARQVPLVSSVLGRVCEPSVDAFVISFPKCGRTWMRVQLARILQQHFGLEEQDWIAIEAMAQGRRDVPKIRLLNADKPERKRPHELHASVVSYFRHRKVVLLVRDPRDVVVSMYMQRTKRGMRPPFSGTLSEFLDEPVGSFDTLIQYYNLWSEPAASTENRLIVRYEDLRAEPSQELRRVVDFIGLSEVEDTVIDEAVAFGAFDNMRAMEKRGSIQKKQMRPGDPNDEESFKTRKGQVGGYVEYLNAEQVASLERRMRDSLSAFYLDSVRDPRPPS